METTLLQIGLGIICLLMLSLTIFGNKRDQREHGKITKVDRRNSYISVVVWFVGLLVIYKIYSPVYIAFVVGFLVYSQIFEMGRGKRGLFRQIRDGGFVACIATIPICLIWYSEKV